jgi:hypothetical protein
MELILSYMYRGEINVEESGIVTIRILFIDADPDPVPDWQQNNADPHVETTPKCLKIRKKIFFQSQHCHFTVQCLIFLVSVKCVICFQYFGQHIEILWKKVYNFMNFFICLELLPIRIGLPRFSIPIRQNDADLDPQRCIPYIKRYNLRTSSILKNIFNLKYLSIG